MHALPIDQVIPDVLRELQGHPCLVVEAAAGAGKTTRIPWAIAQAPWCRGRVLVSEPRRIAARLAARRVADEQRLALGQEVGYRVRFEEAAGPDTRLIYLTEGVLLQQLARDPLLSGVDCVVVDEVHERSLDLDLCLALLDRIRREKRPELRLVAMSATLDADAVAQFLGDCPRVRSEGRTYPVEVQHAPRPDDRPLDKRVRSAVRQVLDRQAQAPEQKGDVLVFLPGAAEIRRCQEALQELPADLEVLALHGDLPLADQARAISPGTRQRVVLATNVAESSVTIPQVTAVIDSGLARVSRHSPWSGLRSLELEEISQARVLQRTGRAGRTRPGLAIRLYTAGQFAARPAQDPPAIEREDLSGAVLALAAQHITAPDALRWLTPPPPGAWKAAVTLLESLGALDAGQLNDTGRRMLRFPLHPRLARLLVEGERQGCADLTCLAAALLSERDIRREARSQWGGATFRHRESGDSDLLEMVDRFREAASESFSRQALSRLELDPTATKSVDRIQRQLVRRLDAHRAPTVSDEETLLARCLLTAFNDRVAQRRGEGQELLLCTGTTARLAETSVVHRAPWLVALAADRAQGKRDQAIVRVASRIEPDWLLDQQTEQLHLEEILAFDPTGDRIEQISRFRYGRLVLDESRARAQPGPQTAEVLLKAAHSKGLAVTDPQGTLTQLEVRLQLLFEARLSEIDPAGLDVRKRGLELGCAQVTSLSELAQLDLADLLLTTLPGDTSRLLAEETPLRVRLPSGRYLSVNYELGKAPWIQSRLQDFFGMGSSPLICRERIPLQIHLLAPNQRAVQVTTDLAGFWDKHYPSIRKELMRRYPRHPWPEDGRSATPPEPRPRRPAR